MANESLEWNEKLCCKRRKGKLSNKGSRNPFEVLKSECCLNLDDEDDVESLLERILEDGAEGLEARFDEFANRVTEAGRKTIEDNVLDDESQVEICYACERVIQEERALLSQTCELLADDDTTEEDGCKAALFYYASFETAAETICQIVADVLR